LAVSYSATADARIRNDDDATLMIRRS